MRGATPPRTCDTARVGEEDSGDHLEQGALASAVAADEANGLAGVHVEGDVLQRPERVRRSTAATLEEEFAQLQLAPPRPEELDAEVLDGDDRFDSSDLLEDAALEAGEDA